MATEDKKYWLGLEDKDGLNEGTSKEFDLDHPVMSGIDNALTKEKSTRRDFLKVLGFSVSAAAIAASCEMPVRKSIPYTIKPEEIIPGIPNYYATAYTKGGEYNSLLVKTREGRPILFEGNKMSSITRGGVNSKAMGSLLSLYDDNRIKNPLKGKEKSSWDVVTKEISEKLAATTGKIAFLSSTILSPSVKRAISKFSEKYTTTEHVQFDAVSYSGLLDANFENFGKRAIPNYKFDQAEL
ncbi:MAG: MoCo/4Fe-4S cofactor protein with predicted Tat translocation signal, partial [Planctomycetota bacterium]